MLALHAGAQGGVGDDQLAGGDALGFGQEHASNAPECPLDGLANEAAYALAIRDWLTSRYGIAARRRVITDPADAPSLHDGIRP